jgi:histidinol phosphatase-like PHP family hydrolase
VAETASTRLDEDVLCWFRVLTHVHTDGISACSGQQTPADVVAAALSLGFHGVVLNEHTGDPTAPYLLESDGPEIRLLRSRARETAEAAQAHDFDLRFGLECNTVGAVSGFRLDTPLDAFEPKSLSYVIGSLHREVEQLTDPKALMRAIEMLCLNPRVDTLGHITREIWHAGLDWSTVAQLAADTGTMIELNLNQWFKELGQNLPRGDDSPAAGLWRDFLEAVAGTSALTIIGADIHNAGMWPTHRPTQGWETSVRRIRVFHGLLADFGFTPEWMVGSSRDRFDLVLGTPKADRPKVAA